MKPRKTTPASKVKKVERFEFDVEQTLLKNKQIFLFGDIDEYSELHICQKLYALDTLNKNPIHLYINSGGGCTDSGISIINTMESIQSPVITIIKAEACSMAGIISVCGDKRVCYTNSNWMGHAMACEVEGKVTDIKDRAKYLEKYDNMLERILREHTTLSSKDITKARNGELWLFADEMLDKEIVDEVITFE